MIYYLTIRTLADISYRITTRYYRRSRTCIDNKFPLRYPFFKKS